MTKLSESIHAHLTEVRIPNDFGKFDVESTNDRLSIVNFDNYNLSIQLDSRDLSVVIDVISKSVEEKFNYDIGLPALLSLTLQCGYDQKFDIDEILSVTGFAGANTKIDCILSAMQYLNSMNICHTSICFFARGFDSGYSRALST